MHGAACRVRSREEKPSRHEALIELFQPTIVSDCPCGCGRPRIGHSGIIREASIQRQRKASLQNVTVRYYKAIARAWLSTVERAAEQITGARLVRGVPGGDVSGALFDFLDEMFNDPDAIAVRFGEEAIYSGHTSARLGAPSGVQTKRLLDPALSEYLHALKTAGFDRVRDSVMREMLPAFRERFNELFAMGKPALQTAHVLFEEFGRNELWKWQRLARSEGAMAHGIGFVEQARSDGAQAYEWSAAADACPICEPLDGQIFSLDGDHPLPVEDTHPNCLCDLQVIYDMSDLEAVKTDYSDILGEVESARAALWTPASLEKRKRGGWRAVAY